MPEAALHLEVERAWAEVRARLLREKGGKPHWTGLLSQSALSTATAISALSLIDHAAHRARIARGLEWLARTQNSDGGWGDTVRSRSNISTTWLVRAAFALQAPHISENNTRHAGLLENCRNYLERNGGSAAVVARYGEDRTFSAPILTNLALAELVAWDDCPVLPFWLAAFPRKLFQALGLRVVSYALPALIAVGLAGFTRRKKRSVWQVLSGRLARKRVLALLTEITPESGGYLEATPLTSFVAMSLVAAGEPHHPVLAHNVRFLCAEQDADGAWKIDRDLAMWLTSLSVCALGGGESATRDWLLAQQSRTVHPYVGSAAGSWGWTYHSGSVPDADDTSGALLALSLLPEPEASLNAARNGIRWLLDIQNGDGGWPTFCKGWQKLPFDRSCPDITAHALRAFSAWRIRLEPALQRRMGAATRRGIAYLTRAQRPDGSWIPLWFGNEHVAHDENPVLGTARALLAAQAVALPEQLVARGVAFLQKAQHSDGGWGGAAEVPASVEETAVACEALAAIGGAGARTSLERGLAWLCQKISADGLDAPAPIGLYFAKLWYFERLYPLIFAASAFSAYFGQREKTLPSSQKDLQTQATFRT